MICGRTSALSIYPAFFFVTANLGCQARINAWNIPTFPNHFISPIQSTQMCLDIAWKRNVHCFTYTELKHNVQILHTVAKPGTNTHSFIFIYMEFSFTKLDRMTIPFLTASFLVCSSIAKRSLSLCLSFSLPFSFTSRERITIQTLCFLHDVNLSEGRPDCPVCIWGWTSHPRRIKQVATSILNPLFPFRAR